MWGIFKISRVPCVTLRASADRNDKLENYDAVPTEMTRRRGTLLTVAAFSNFSAEDPVFVADVSKNHRNENDYHGEHEDKGLG